MTLSGLYESSSVAGCAASPSAIALGGRESAAGALRTDDLVGGLWLPGDGSGSPTDLTMSFAAGARQLGVSIFEGVGVRGFRTASVGGGSRPRSISSASRARSLSAARMRGVPVYGSSCILTYPVMYVNVYVLGGSRRKVYRKDTGTALRYTPVRSAASVRWECLTRFDTFPEMCLRERV